MRSAILSIRTTDSCDRAASRRRSARTSITTAAGFVALFAMTACQEDVSPVAPRIPIAPNGVERTLTGASSTDIFAGAPTGMNGDARGLNNLGQVTGSAIGQPFSSDDYRPYRWTPGSGFTQTYMLCCGTAYGTDINDAGAIAGTAQVDQQKGLRAFRATGTTMVELGILPGTDIGGSGRANAINSAGMIVGSSQTPTFQLHAVLWDASNVIQDLGTLGGSNSNALDVNDAGQVIGTSQLAGDATTVFFIWTAGAGMQDLTPLLGTATSLVGINDAGQIAGTFTNAGGQSHAFLYSPGSGVLDLGTLGGASSTATGLNNNGQVVGNSTLANGATHDFLWTPSDGMEDVTAISGVTGIRLLNDQLQTLTGRAVFSNRQQPSPRVVQLTVVPSGNKAPVADFTISCPALQCFADASTSTDDAGIVSYAWTWGNGKAKTVTSPTTSTTYYAAGVYSVTLTVRDASGLTGTITKQVTVPTARANQSPSAAISSPTSGASVVQGNSLTFTGSATDPEDGGLSGSALVWTSSIDAAIGSGSSFARSDLSVGTHTITLTATDSKGATGTSSITVTVTAPAPPPPTNQPPVAGFTVSCTGMANPRQCAFDASSSTDDGGIVSYAWSWGNGRAETKAMPTVRNTWAAAGDYVVTLTVTDAAGLTGSIAKTVTIP